MLGDSNIIIYAAKVEFDGVRGWIRDHMPATSIISYVEVLGYHRLREFDRRLFEVFFQNVEILPLSVAIRDRAVGLRQQRSIKLGDSIIAATALIHDLTLATHNTDDFAWISDLKTCDLLEGDGLPTYTRSKVGEFFWRKLRP